MELNLHNKNEYDPMRTEETYYLVYKTKEQKNEIKYVLLPLFIKIKTCL